MYHDKHSAGFVLHHPPRHAKPSGHSAMMRAACAFLAAACLVLSVTVYPASAATSMSSLQNKLDKISASIKQHKTELNDAKKKAGTSRGTKEKGGKSSVAGALADFQKSAGGAGGGGGGEGDGPGGGGIYDVYMGQVILAVRPNWSMPTYSRANLSVQVNVKLDPNGKVLSCTVARSSGRAEVDASAVNAVIRTKVLPAPPTPDQQELLLTFNTQEMMGRR
mgnify:CR=1 FL=1